MKPFARGELIAIEYAYPEGYGYGDVSTEICVVLDRNEIALYVHRLATDTREWVNMQASVVVGARTLTEAEMAIHKRRTEEAGENA